MRVSAVRPVIVMMMLSALLNITVPITVAQETPVVEATPTLRAELPEEFCTEDEIDQGNRDIVERPEGGALVKPAITTGRDLYLLELTLPPGTCVGYGSHYLHDGAMSWLVQSGEIEFATQPVAGMPAATATGVGANGVDIVVSESPTTLASGDWVTIDRAAEYSYRNAGPEPAVVLMAVNEWDPFGNLMRSCKGGCRKR
jgi:hypothetical protein